MVKFKMAVKSFKSDLSILQAADELGYVNHYKMWYIPHYDALHLL